MGRRAFRHQEHRAPACVNGDLGRQMPWLQLCSSVFFPSFIYWAWSHTAWNNNLWVSLVSCPGSVPSQSHVHRQTPRCREAWKRALMLCRNYSAVTKAWLCYQLYFHQKSKTQNHASYYEENQPYSTLKPVQERKNSDRQGTMDWWYIFHIDQLNRIFTQPSFPTLFPFIHHFLPSAMFIFILQLLFNMLSFPPPIHAL